MEHYSALKSVLQLKMKQLTYLTAFCVSDNQHTITGHSVLVQSTWKAQAGASGVQGQPELCENLSQKTTTTSTRQHYLQYYGTLFNDMKMSQKF